MECDAGELHGAPDADALVTQLVGALFFRELVAHRRTTDVFIDHLIDTALAPWSTR